MSHHEAIEKAQDAFGKAAYDCAKAMLAAGWSPDETNSNLDTHKFAAVAQAIREHKGIQIGRTS